ncbi:hypothetical protein P3T73_06850 [Kiritimatiellota bacterium B12222]|nr:hypothetical protein P3T73_06850 [Kiritimatiellota bacterium B12222]
MKAIESPFENGQIPKHSIHRIFCPWRAYRKSIKEQVRERGPVSQALWGTEKRKRIANTISNLIKNYCWGIDLEFAPNDPWFVIGELEVGDLSEIELIMAIECEFSVVLPDDLFGREEVFTFEEMVDLIESTGQPEVPANLASSVRSS